MFLCFFGDGCRAVQFVLVVFHPDLILSLPGGVNSGVAVISCEGAILRFITVGEFLGLVFGVDFLGQRFGLTSCHSVLVAIVDIFSKSLKYIASSYSISDASHRSGSCSFKNGIVFSFTRLRRVA